MTGTAIYHLVERGRVLHFFGATAGDYQSAFDALKCILNEGSIGIHADVTMNQLVYNPDWPRDITVYDADCENGDFVFAGLDAEHAQRLESNSGIKTDCEITLDIDSGVIRFQPNPALKTPPVTALELPIEQGLRCYDGALSNVLGGSAEDYAEALNEVLAQKLPEAAAEWQLIRGRNALYTVLDSEGTHHFSTRYGGGYFNPLASLVRMRDTASELHWLGQRTYFAYIMRGMQYTSRSVGVPVGYMGREMFEELTPDKASQLRNALQRQETIGELVCIDLRKEALAITHGRALPECGTTLTVAFADVSEYLRRAEEDASLVDGKMDSIDALERSIGASLRGIHPEQTHPHETMTL